MANNQTKHLATQIAALEASITDKSGQLKAAEAKWEDYKAGNLRLAIRYEQTRLHDLKARRASLAPLEAKQSRAIFYGSNH